MGKYEELGKKDTRSGFGVGLHQAGQQDARIVALCADLIGSLKMDAFVAEFPERYVECGIAEANMMGMAAGLALDGLVPFAGTFAAFATGRVYDQIRQSIAYSNTNVKIAASHAGITLGEDGATHQILEDIGLMKMLPNMTVIVPADYHQTIQATRAAAEMNGPVYLRFGRPSVPVFIPEAEPFTIGKAQRLIEGRDVSIFATGHLVWEALQAARQLEQKGISAEVINIHTIKPLDQEAIVASAKKTGAVVTAEEHMRNGGLGDSIAQTLAQHYPTPQEFVAVEDTFGESGKPAELMQKYGLTAERIVECAQKAIQRKK
ncbi:MAG: transketolase [Bacteroidia bacterium]|nr:MAG: transketolase [Bacteroidia bacterium]